MVTAVVFSKGNFPYLTETVESLAMQTFKDFNIVIVNEGKVSDIKEKFKHLRVNIDIVDLHFIVIRPY